MPKKIENDKKVKSEKKLVKEKKEVVKKSQPNLTNKKNSSSKKDKKSISSDYTYATGKRKNSIAKVWVKKGNGIIVINGLDAKKYLKRDILNTIINLPFDKTDRNGKFDVICQVIGGGLSGQAGAIKHAISIALQLLEPELRTILKKLGFLTRDSRVVERKKSGNKKARKGQVYQRR